MEIFGCSLGQTVGQSLQQHGIIGVSFPLEPLFQRFGTDTGRHHKSADIIRTPFRYRHHIIGQRLINSLLPLRLLTQNRKQDLTHTDIIPVAICREETINRLAILGFHLNQAVQQLNSILVQLHSLRRLRPVCLREFGQPGGTTSIAIVDPRNFRKTPVQFPGTEKEGPMNIWDYFFQRNIRNHLHPAPGRDNRTVRSPVDLRTIRPGFRQRNQDLFFLVHGSTQSLILTVQLGNISIPRIRVQQFGRNQRVLRSIQHMNDRIVIMRSDLNGRMQLRSRGAPHHYGNTQAGFLHLVRHMHHLFERRRDQTGKTDQIRLLFDCLFYDHVCRNHHSQIDHLIIVASQDDRNNILSDVMHITFHCRKQDLSSLSRIRRDLFRLNCRLQDSNRLFHRTGSLDNLR